MPSTEVALIPKPRETVASLREKVVATDGKLGRALENLARLQLAIEDRNWQQVGNAYEATGVDLKSIQTIAEELRTWIIASGIIKKIAETRGNIVYGDGVGFKDFSKAVKAFESPINRTKLFSAEALKEINRAHGSDGNVVFLVEKATKELTRFGVDEMGAPFVDSRDKERIWFVRRIFTEVTTEHPEGKTVDEYYPTDLCPPAEATKTKITQLGGTDIPINNKYTAVVWGVNKQVGWPLGIPDLFPALQWAEKYTDFLKDQAKFAKALATLAWEFHALNTDDAKKVAAAISGRKEAAGSAVHTAGMEAKPLPGNSGVSFDNGAALAAQAAAAGEITIDDVLAVGQYGAGISLDPNVRKMAAGRRQSAEEIFKRIGKLLGAPNLKVIWPDFEDESPFREAQMIISAWATGMFSPEELRDPLAARVRIPLAEGSKAPKGVITPNNQKAIDDAAKAAADAAALKAAQPDAANDLTNAQGKDALGVGKTTDGDNTARDKGETP